MKFISFEFPLKFVQADHRRLKRQAVEPGDKDDDLESILSGISVNGMHVFTNLSEETVTVFPFQAQCPLPCCDKIKSRDQLLLLLIPSLDFSQYET